jgi:hypothetical protein
MTDLGPDTRTEADYARAASNQYEIERRFEIERTARELYQSWRTAYTDLEAARTDDTVDDTARAEQEAYDALVDFVEANDLIDSEFDPRDVEEA